VSVAVVMIAASLAAVPTALASGDSALDDRVRANGDQIARWLVRDQPIDPTRLPAGAPQCSQVCDDLYLSEHRPIAGQPSSQQIWRELNREMWKARLRRGIQFGVKTVTRISAGANAFLGGYWIGMQLNKAFRHDLPGQPPAPGTIPPIIDWRSVTKGEQLVGQSSSTERYVLVAPDDGFKAVFNSPITWDEGAPCSNPTRPKFTSPTDSTGAAGGVWLETPGLTTTCWSDYNDNGVSDDEEVFQQKTKTAAYWTPYSPIPTVTYDPFTMPGLKQTGYLSNPAPDWPTFRDSVIDDLIENADDYPKLRAWIDATTGGPSDDPVTSTRVVPECAGETVERCGELLEIEGITNYRVTEAPVEQGDPEIEPGNVLDTMPPAGTEIDKDDEVVERKNPPPPPIDTSHPRDERCETALPDDPGPGSAWRSATPPYFNGRDENGDDVVFPFYFGTPYPEPGAWGWRHIAVKHGWDPYVEANVTAALTAADPANEFVRREPDGSLTYWRYFTHKDTGEPCTMVVIARDRPNPPEIRTIGIITAFAAPGHQPPQGSL
jgi:hypothetical protein